MPARNRKPDKVELVLQVNEFEDQKDSTIRAKKQMLEMLLKTLGVVTPACDKLGISWSTHYRWMKTDPLYAQSVLEIEDKALDFAEYELYRHIKNGDKMCLMFYLRTKGRKRGYGDKLEIQRPQADTDDIIFE